MKTLAGKLLLCGLLIAALKLQAQSQPVTVTFDDVPTTWDGYSLTAEVPPGYKGLCWGGFRILNSMDPPIFFAGTGYRNGVVSPRQVAWSISTAQQTLFSPEPMTLKSAYLTAALASELRVEVQAFRGFQLAYDESYTINMSAPTLVTFNFADVTRVTFIPEGIFVMDNLIYVVPEPGLGPVLVGFLGLLALRGRVNSADRCG